MISVHPHVYGRLIKLYPDLADIVIPEIEVTQSAAWHAAGTPPDWLDQFGPGTVEWLHTDFIGMEHIPDVGSTLVTNGRGTTEDIVAEWVLTATLMACKRLGHYRKWSDRYGQKPILLREAAITIVGRGAIGSESERVLKGAGARDVVVTGASNLDPVRLADIVVLATSRRAETLGLINSEEMAKWKKGSWLVSISHGGVIDDYDLSCALANGLPAGAIIDGFETEPLPDNSELWSLAILSPHLAWYSPESTTRRVATFRARLKEWQGA